MANTYFQFKEFIIEQSRCAMKVTTDACLFGAWVANAIKNNKVANNQALDIGAGTGLLSLMIAQKNLLIKIDAVEIDNNAFEQAKENIAASPWHNSITLHHSDIKKLVLTKSYSVIISNPPFYENDLPTENESKNIAHHNKGLLFSALLPIIKTHLAEKGKFFLLIPYKRLEEVKKICTEQELNVNTVVYIRQSVTHSFFRCIVVGDKISNTKITKKIQEEIAIKETVTTYTVAFTTLLKDYYLHLE